jgi:hypothetical protein
MRVCLKSFSTLGNSVMDKRLKALCVQLGKMSSELATDWMISTYPVDAMEWGEALLLIPHRTWKRSDQKRLARYYFCKLPFSGGRGYEVFASIMPLQVLVACILERLPTESSRIELLCYYLVPVLERFAKNESDRQMIVEFVTKLHVKE